MRAGGDGGRRLDPEVREIVLVESLTLSSRPKGTVPFTTATGRVLEESPEIMSLPAAMTLEVGGGQRARG